MTQQQKNPSSAKRKIEKHNENQQIVPVSHPLIYSTTIFHIYLEEKKTHIKWSI